MYCYNCAKPLPPGATACPACGAPVVTPPPPAAAKGDEPVAAMVAEVRKAAKELTVVSARLTKHLASTAESAAKDPKGTAKRVGKRVADEVDRLGKELDQALRDL